MRGKGKVLVALKSDYDSKKLEGILWKEQENEQNLSSHVSTHGTQKRDKEQTQGEVQELLFSVSDNGPGISREGMRNLFQAYQQLPSPSEVAGYPEVVPP